MKNRRNLGPDHNVAPGDVAPPQSKWAATADQVSEGEPQRAVEQGAEDERLFSATMIESMPGIIYFYDEQRRFLRWNRNFETASGYSAEEIRQMHPLDFFPEGERERLKQRIGEVFTQGESSVEALFLSKDGRTTPYLFTGRRVELNGRPCLVGMGVDISKRKQAELALQASEAKLRALFEQAPLGIAVLDSTLGLFLKVNPQYCRIAGHSEEELLASDFQHITHPDDLAADLANMERLRADGSLMSRTEKRYLRADGSIVWVRLTCVPLSRPAAAAAPQHIAMVEDITARKQTEARLMESEQKYRELVELANSIIIRWNPKGQITFLNEFGQRFFGYRAEEIIGRHVLDTIVPARDQSGRDLQDLMAQICAHPQAFEHNINENVRRNGERVWISWTNRILRDTTGEVAEILSIGSDITKQFQAEQSLRVLNHTLELEVATRTEALRAALVRAEAADRLKSAFLATMSHELRTPLNSIIGFTGIVLQGLAGPLTAEQSKQLGMVRTSARHLLELINDILDLSKIEASQLEVGAEEFNLEESIERVTALIRPLAEKKNLSVTVNVGRDLEAVISDRRRVEQILLNLLSNAVKFTDHGSVVLRAERLPGHSFSPTAPPTPAVRVSVADTGIGIKPEDMAALFQPFHQLDGGMQRQREGTGLGLAICRKLAELLDGDITAASVWRQGSEFTLLLPAIPIHHS
jgi:PAS domain S-box-containing protein